MVLVCFHGDTLSGVMDALLNSKEHVVGTFQGTPFCLSALLELLSWNYSLGTTIASILEFLGFVKFELWFNIWAWYVLVHV
jgi:hypothetical protein